MQEQTTTHVAYQKQKRVAYITLNRPEKRNAFSQDLVGQLKEVFAQAQADKEIKVVVLQAAGKVFCAGADLAYLQKLQDFSYEENLIDSTFLKELYHLIYTFPKFVIAAVQGHAIAGGCGLVTVCDYAIAVPEAKFGYTEVKIGFVPAIVMPFLVRKIGESRARQLLLTGDLISAQEAHAYGIIHELVPAENLEKRVADFAQKICDTSSGVAIKLTKSMLISIMEEDLENALDEGAEMNARARQTDDCQRGIAAFLNKEKLSW